MVRLARQDRQLRELINWVAKYDGEWHVKNKDTIVAELEKADMTKPFDVLRTSVSLHTMVNFANVKWLSDVNMFVIARVLANRISDDVHVIDPVFLEFKDNDERRRQFEGENGILARLERTGSCCVRYSSTSTSSTGAVLCSTSGSTSAGSSTRKNKSDYLEEVESIVTTKIMPLFEVKLEIHQFADLRQTDGGSCGVFVANFFHVYMGCDDPEIDLPWVYQGDAGILTKANVQALRMKYFEMVWSDRTIH